VVGTILTDPKGRTLYIFTKDTEANKSTCAADCLANWPAFTAEAPLTLPMGVDGELSSFDRSDGSTQVSYNGMPLYYFAGDSGAGDINGQGKGGVWFVAHPGEQMGVMSTPEAEVPVASPEPMTAGSVDFTISEYKMESSAANFKVGEEYTFQIMNSGQMTHEFIIEKAGAVDEPLEANGNMAEVEGVAAGSTASLTWTFTEPGTYQVACHLPGHYEAGVVLTIHVTT
jgi:predicted lipoprotein with Yx(FWY)xxD motif/uncharacterized cupredoxin-like copper-binding protein